MRLRTLFIKLLVGIFVLALSGTIHAQSAAQDPKGTQSGNDQSKSSEKPRPGMTRIVVLHGEIVTPLTFNRHGWITIENGLISAISEKKPKIKDAIFIETEGIIFPGFVDLHNHPIYNAIPRWPAQPAKFKNRYEWRGNPDYARNIGTPGRELQADEGSFCDLEQYAEVMAMIGGTTSITGLSPRRGATPPVPECVKKLVRNLDWFSGLRGDEIGHERVESVLGVTPGDLRPDALLRVKGELTTNAVDLIVVHVAEGARKDEESMSEFKMLKDAGMFTPHVGIIHGVALQEVDFKEMHAMGVPLIWSPSSNIDLYGETSDIVAANKAGVTLALAPDWAPSGTQNMLAEIAFASRYSQEHLHGAISDKKLFEMATSSPARIAHLDDKIGSLKVGLHADLFVLKSDAKDPFTALAHAEPGEVELVMVDGVPLSGSPDLLGKLSVRMEMFPLCGSPMALNAEELPRGSMVDVMNRLDTALGKYGLKAVSAVCQ